MSEMADRMAISERNEGCTATTVHLEPGIVPDDLAVEASDCGQYLMLMCGKPLIALMGEMGCDVDAVEFADGRRYRVEELLERVAG